jgi:hypothetical protein
MFGAWTARAEWIPGSPLPQGPVWYASLLRQTSMTRRGYKTRSNRDFLGWEPCLANPIEHLTRSKPLLRSRLLHSSLAHSQVMHMQAGSQSGALLMGSYRRVSG